MEKGRAVSEAEIDFVVRLLIGWIDGQTD